MADESKKLTFLYLSMEDVLKVGLTMVEAIDVCEESFRQHALGNVENPPKPGVHPLPDAFIHAMPGYLKELRVAGLKWVAGFPTNVPKKLPTIVGVLVLNDCETGFPTAIMDGTYITAIRTAAASGVTAKYLARKDSEVLAVIGTGVQGKYNTICMLHSLKNLKTIKIYDVYPPSIEGFKSQLAPYLGDRIKIQVASNCEEALANADVIVTATGKLLEPIFFDKWVKPGALVLAIHAQGWNRDALVKFDKVVVDDFNQFTSLTKSYYSPVPDAPYAELGDIVAGKKPGRENDQEKVIVFNAGLAIHDMIVGAKILEKAKELGIGIKLDLMDFSKPLPLPRIS